MGTITQLRKKRLVFFLFFVFFFGGGGRGGRGRRQDNLLQGNMYPLGRHQLYWPGNIIVFQLYIVRLWGLYYCYVMK